MILFLRTGRKFCFDFSTLTSFYLRNLASIPVDRHASERGKGKPAQSTEGVNLSTSEASSFAISDGHAS
jgi:hypothetical protein